MRFKDVKEITEVTEKTAMETEIDNLPDEIDDQWLIEHGWAEVSPSNNLPDEIDDQWLIEHGWAEVSPSNKEGGEQ